MKRWAWLVAGLYVLTIVVLTVPVILSAFAPTIRWNEAIEAYVRWPYWLWLAVMFLSQLALLTVPVRVTSRRPTTQNSLWPTILAGGLMMGGLAIGAICSIYEFVFRDQYNGHWIGWTAIGTGFLAWCIWSAVFYRMGRDLEPGDVVSRQCRALLKGSILELLIAVPTHIVARYRDNCCGGLMTFIGLTMGFSVMLFSFGPSVFFLFVDRWKRLHPDKLHLSGRGR